jgi:hypothetical protein
MDKFVRGSPVEDLLDVHVHDPRQHLVHGDYDLLQLVVSVCHVAIGEQIGLVRPLEQEAQPAVEREADEGDHVRRAADHEHRPLQTVEKEWVQTRRICVMFQALKSGTVAQYGAQLGPNFQVWKGFRNLNEGSRECSAMKMVQSETKEIFWVSRKGATLRTF